MIPSHFTRIDTIEDSIDIYDLLIDLYRLKTRFIISFICFMILAFGIYKVYPKKYVTSVKILINDNNFSSNTHSLIPSVFTSKTNQTNAYLDHILKSRHFKFTLANSLQRFYKNNEPKEIVGKLDFKYSFEYELLQSENSLEIKYRNKSADISYYFILNSIDIIIQMFESYNFSKYKNIFTIIDIPQYPESKGFPNFKSYMKKALVICFILSFVFMIYPKIKNNFKLRLEK